MEKMQEFELVQEHVMYPLVDHMKTTAEMFRQGEESRLEILRMEEKKALFRLAKAENELLSP